jgi:guanylate kinase
VEGRATDAPEVITKRIERAAFELSFAKDFDKIVINDDLSTAQAETLNIVEAFLTKE